MQVRVWVRWAAQLPLVQQSTMEWRWKGLLEYRLEYVRFVLVCRDARGPEYDIMS